MSTEEFFQFIGNFGHGVLTYSLAREMGLKPDTIKKYISRNEEFFDIYKGDRVLSNVIVMKKSLYEKLNIEGTPTKSQAPSSLTDILLVNAYLIEKEIKTKWSYKPHFVLDNNGEKIGIISQNWSVSKPFKQYDILLSVKNHFKSADIDTISRNLASRDNSSKEEAINWLTKKTYTPRALEHFRAE